MADDFEDFNEEEAGSAPALPSFVVAADTHNLANTGYSWSDTATKGTVGVVASAVAQIADIAPTLGNALGGDFEHITTSDLLQNFDDSYDKYYKDHQLAIDGIGFALSSIVPGTAGVKVARAGGLMLRTAALEGKLGANMAKATSILAPSQPKLLAAAMQKALQPNAGFAVANSNTMKLIATGFAESVFEGAAFETAVAATMSNSPILAGQSAGDLASNIVHSSLVFGAFGGVFRGAGAFYKVKNAGKELDAIAAKQGWSIVPELDKSATQSDRILAYLDDLHSTPTNFDAFAATAEDSWKAAKFKDLYESKVRYVETKVRALTGELAKGDEALADVLYKNYRAMPADEVAAKVWKTEEVVRLSAATDLEKSLVKLNKQKQLLLDVGADTTVLAAQVPNKAIVYLKVAGEGTEKGMVAFEEAPKVIGIADSLKAGDNYAQAVRSARQTMDKAWNPLESDVKLAEARYVTAAKHVFKEGEIPLIDGGDIPYLQAAYLKELPEVHVKNFTGDTIKFTDRNDLLEFIANKKRDVADYLVQEQGVSVEAAAKITDMRVDFTSGYSKGELVDNIFLTKTGEEFSKPQWAKAVKNLDEVLDTNGNVVQGMAAIAQKQVLYKEAAARNAALVLGEDVEKFNTLSQKDVLKANSFGVGGGMFSSQNENYGTLASKVQEIGRQTLGVIDKFKSATRNEFEPLLYKLGQNQAAAIEWSTLNAKLRSIPVAYGFDSANGVLKPRVLMKYEADLAAGKNVTVPTLPEGVPLEIAVKHAETQELLATHISKNGQRQQQLGSIRSTQGVKWDRDLEAFYPIPPNPKDYPHFAFVIDDTITGYGQSQMIHAASPEALEQSITSLKASNSAVKVLTKKDAEEWYKAVGQYEFERSLTDVAYDASRARGGKSASYMPATDPQKIIADTLNWHLDRDTNLVRETVLHMNEAEVATLRGMGEKFAAINNSHYSKLDPLSYVDMQRDNPFANYVKSMLGLNTAKDFPFWSPVNELLDRKFSSVFTGARDAVLNATNEEELLKVNQMLRDSGYEGATYNAGMLAAANHVAPRGALSSFMAKANSIISACQLGWDPINAVNNVVGATVLRTTELRSLIKGIEKADPKLAGELAGLSRVSVPGTGGDSAFSPAKLIAKAMGDFHSESGKELRAVFRERGIISDRVEQLNWAMDNLALTGKEGVSELNGKIGASWKAVKDVFKKGDQYTGNKLAEEFNRFVSGHVVKQITDRAVAAGVIGEKEAWSYINTFVNRVEGNYIAAQRPGVFQGPVGQAIGLFQSYQFNLMQQAFRYMGEGSAKDIAMLTGLQTTLYGLKGLPAFDAINTHIVGKASGNKEHTDMYSMVVGNRGNEAGEWLMYGMPSNALGLIHPDLKFNLYSRGDINPRNVTLLPINPANTPIYQMSERFLGSVKDTATKIAQGGDVWTTMLQGIEHAGVNRPLAGLAQMLQAAGNPEGKSFSTSTKGNVIAAHDFLSLANFTRIAGAKPLDEAISLDLAYRNQAYAAADLKKRQQLGATVKTTMIGGKMPDQEQLDEFAVKYAAVGGRQENFAKWSMGLYKSANTSQINALKENLQSPTGRAMQRWMGGYEMEDFM